MLDAIKWAWDQVLALFAHQDFSAAASGLALGVAFTDFVARMLPARIDAEYAARLVRLVVFGIVTIAAFALNPTPTGAVLALLVGAAAPAVQVLMLRAIYARWPAMKPPALVACPTDNPPPKSLRE